MVKINIKISGLDETLTALKTIPESAKEKILDASWDLSQSIAKNIRVAARSQGAQTGLLAGTVTTGEALLPQVTVGGSSVLTTKGKRKKPFKAFQDVFGAEFGATFLPQFKARDPSGYFIFPTVDDMSDEIEEKWNEAAEKVIAEFSEE